MQQDIKGSKAYIRGTYEELLLYYYKRGIGKKSEIAGAIISESMIATLETRYRQLGGDPVRLRLKEYMPSSNGSVDYEN